MKDLREKLEKLRADADDCALISRLAVDKVKRETFARLAEHLTQMAADIEGVIAAKIASGETQERPLSRPGLFPFHPIPKRLVLLNLGGPNPERLGCSEVYVSRCFAWIGSRPMNNSAAQHCRDQAAECIRLMKLAQSSDEAQVLRNISSSWSRLSGQIDRYNALVRERGRRARE
jgi:hypothetical protein